MIHWQFDEWFDLARITRHQLFDIIVQLVNVTSRVLSRGPLANFHGKRRATRAVATAAATAVTTAAAASVPATGSSFSGAIALLWQGCKYQYRYYEFWNFFLISKF